MVLVLSSRLSVGLSPEREIPPRHDSSTEVTGARISGIVGMLGPELLVDVPTVMADFGQFFDQLWPIVVLTDFGQTNFGQF